MTSSLQPIILGGGIQAGTPFSLRAIPMITVVTPPTIADSVMFQTAAGDIIVGPTDPAPAATESLRTAGGFVSDTGVGHQNLIAGQGTVAQAQANARNVVIGTQGTFNPAICSGNANLTNNVVIGPGAAIAGTNTLGNNVVIGADVIYSYSAGFQAGNNVFIGNSFVISAFYDGVIIGGAAIPPAGAGTGVLIGRQVQMSNPVSNAIAIGNTARVDAGNTIAFGDGARARATTSIALGRNADATTANGMVIGGQNLGIFDYLLGEGPLAPAVATTLTHRHTGSQGTDAAGGIVNYRGSIGTGQGIGGGLRFQVGERAAASGVGGQTPVDALEIEGGSQNVGVISPEGGGLVGDYGGARGAFYLGLAAQIPTTDPAAGFVLYVDPADNTLKARGPGGTVTPIAAP